MNNNANYFKNEEMRQDLTINNIKNNNNTGFYLFTAIIFL